MPVATVIELLLKFGLPLTQQIVVWAKEGKTAVTPEDMALLASLSAYSSTASLAAAGLELVDGKVIPLKS